jgi:hypothetical protein
LESSSLLSEEEEEEALEEETILSMLFFNIIIIVVVLIRIEDKEDKEEEEEDKEEERSRDVDIPPPPPKSLFLLLLVVVARTSVVVLKSAKKALLLLLRTKKLLLMFFFAAVFSFFLLFGSVFFSPPWKKLTLNAWSSLCLGGFLLFFALVSFSLSLSEEKKRDRRLAPQNYLSLSLSVFSEERDVDDDEERIIRGRGVHFCFVQRSEQPPPRGEIFIFFFVVFECIHEKRIFSAPRTQKRRQSGRELSTPIIFAVFEARTLLRYAAFCFRFLSSKFRKRRERHQQ